MDKIVFCASTAGQEPFGYASVITQLNKGFRFFCDWGSLPKQFSPDSLGPILNCGVSLPDENDPLAKRFTNLDIPIQENNDVELNWFWRQYVLVRSQLMLLWVEPDSMSGTANIGTYAAYAKMFQIPVVAVTDLTLDAALAHHVDVTIKPRSVDKFIKMVQWMAAQKMMDDTPEGVETGP